MDQKASYSGPAKTASGVLMYRAVSYTHLDVYKRQAYEKSWLNMDYYSGFPKGKNFTCIAEDRQLSLIHI